MHSMTENWHEHALDMLYFSSCELRSIDVYIARDLWPCPASVKTVFNNNMCDANIYTTTLSIKQATIYIHHIHIIARQRCELHTLAGLVIVNVPCTFSHPSKLARSLVQASMHYTPRPLSGKLID